jgi:predicted metal-binding membrane protein
MAQAEAPFTEEHTPSLASQRVIIGLCLLLLATVSCAWLYQHAMQMRAVGADAEPSVWRYVPANGLMWFIMMMAMMLPSITPTVFLYARFALASANTARSTLVILGAYLAVWAGFSLIAAFAQFLLVRAGVASAADVAIGDRRIMGLLLILAGVYQFSKLKGVCLESCRSPLPFVMRRWKPGWRGALNIGLHHGLHCIGCCWLLMAVLFVGGVMNLTWVVALAILVLAENTAPYGNRVGQAAGVIGLVWGVALLVSSQILR